jgi:hypothetical protein
MPIDTETSSSLTQWLLAAFGIGGGGYKLVTHETRIARLESDHQDNAKKTADNAVGLAEIKGTLKNVDETVQAIRDHLMGKAS